MRTLFIIGNGFDCYAHGLKTCYRDFKDYLTEKFPEYDPDFDGILESTLMPDGDEEYDMDDVVGSIIRTIDECGDPNWSTLEACLGQKYVESILADNEWVMNEIDWQLDDENDKEIRHSIYNNEDLSQGITGAYSKLKELFEEWVRECLGSIDYHNVNKITKPSFRNALFINFNYTHTLETLYDVSPSNVYHFHGDAKDTSSEIYFGHGEEEAISISDSFFGAQSAFEELMSFMRKDTAKVLRENATFFNRIKNVSKIYSYGFSFADVDMCYIEEIARSVDPSKVRWYFNRFDIKNKPDCVDKIRRMGFKVRKSHRW